ARCLAVEYGTQPRRQQRPDDGDLVRPGKWSSLEDEQRLDVLLHALLGMEANRVGRAVPPKSERMRRSGQVMLRLDDPLANFGDDRVRGGHTAPSLRAPPAIRSCRRLLSARQNPPVW